MRDEILDVLEELSRNNLAADGFQLRLEDIDETGVVTVMIEANENACHDCLVPDEMLKGIIEMGIRPVFPQLKHVKLLKNFG